MWLYKNQPIENLDQIPEGSLAFIYQITNLIDNRIYIGRKMLSSNRKSKLTKKDKLLPENSRKRFKRVVKETDWLNYWGSCQELKTDVANLGKENFRREILVFTTTKTDTSFYEMYFQIKMEVLFTNSYNGHLANTKFFKGKVGDLR